MSHDLMAVLILVMAGALAVITIVLIVMLTKGTQGPQGEVGIPGRDGEQGEIGPSPSRAAVMAAVMAHVRSDEWRADIVGAINDALISPTGESIIIEVVRDLLAAEYGLTPIYSTDQPPEDLGDPQLPAMGESGA